MFGEGSLSALLRAFVYLSVAKDHAHGRQLRESKCFIMVSRARVFFCIFAFSGRTRQTRIHLVFNSDNRVLKRGNRDNRVIGIIGP